MANYIILAYTAGNAATALYSAEAVADDPREAAQWAFGQWFKERRSLDKIEYLTVSLLDERYMVPVQPDAFAGPGQYTFGDIIDRASKQVTPSCECCDRTAYTENPYGVQMIVQWALLKLSVHEGKLANRERVDDLIRAVFEVVGALRSLEDGRVPVVHPDANLAATIGAHKTSGEARVDDVLKPTKDEDFGDEIVLHRETKGAAANVRLERAIEYAINVGIYRYLEERQRRGMPDRDVEMVERTTQHAATGGWFLQPMARAMIATGLKFEDTRKDK